MAEFFKCPHPECNHIGLTITKVHCRDAHHMEKEDIFRKYGEPKKVIWKPGKGTNKGGGD